MFATLTSIVFRLAAIRWAIKSVVGLGVLFPAALLLKFVGLPVLAVLGVLALPLLFVLFLLGLPVFLVLLVGGLLLAGVSMVLTFGLFALKIFVFLVLPVWLIWKAVTWLSRPKQATPTDASFRTGTV